MEKCDKLVHLIAKRRDTILIVILKWQVAKGRGRLLIIIIPEKQRPQIYEFVLRISQIVTSKVCLGLSKEYITPDLKIWQLL